jgi:hypothetical protein
MKIKVTQSDIKKGKRKKLTLCPVALAIRRTVKTGRVSVNNLIVTVGARERRLPLDAQTFVRNFDLGRHVEPFAFELPIEPKP